MSKPKPYDALGEVPGNVAPSQLVRYWHRALLGGGFVFGVVYVGAMGIAWLIPNPDGQLIRYTDALQGGLVTGYHVLTAGISARAPAREFIELVSYHHPLATWTRIGASLLLAGYLARFMHDYLGRDPHLALSTHHTPVILTRVRGGDALLGICAGRLPPGHGLCAELLLEEPFYLVGDDGDEVVQPDHQIALQATLTGKLSEAEVSEE